MTYRTTRRLALTLSSLALIAGCSNFDLDLRGKIGGGLNTADAARQATENRPRPDARGIISYPSYQVAVAKRGDTLTSLAARIGANPGALARYNGIQIDDKLRAGEIIALPSRVAEPTGGPIQPKEVDITTLAGSAIERAGNQNVETSVLAPAQTGTEPVRHKVERGETAYTIARLYGVSVRSLGDWNGLDRNLSVREGQYLLIPVASAAAEAAPAAPITETEPPGAGTPTPTPPSAAQPLPEPEPEPQAPQTAAPVSKPAPSAPDLGKTQTSSASPGRMSFPVKGKIVREYSKGRNDGIDIAAAPGASVTAAASGTVAAITKDTNGVPIIVIKHPGNLLTVYSNVDNLVVEKGDSVSRGQKLASLRSGSNAAVHFEVREGFDSVDPMPYLQ